MAILDLQMLKDIKVPDEVIHSIEARMNLQELKDYLYEDENGNLKKLTKKRIFELLNERLTEKDMPEVTKYWFDKWWKLL